MSTKTHESCINRQYKKKSVKMKFINNIFFKIRRVYNTTFLPLQCHRYKKVSSPLIRLTAYMLGKFYHQFIQINCKVIRAGLDIIDTKNFVTLSVMQLKSSLKNKS